VDTFWKQFITGIEKKTTSQNFEMWFKPIKLVDFSSTTVCFSVPKQFYADWLQENYRQLILAVIFEMTGFSPELTFKIQEVEVPSPVISKKPPEIKKEEKQLVLPKNINPLYTFSTFVVGPSNQFVHAACQAVANRPGGTYNPLFIYGGVGLGKTHLLHAIVNQALNINSSLKICYVTSEKFTNELINSIRNEKMAEFRKRYRNIDILLIDDIQFIAGKVSTQEEFFHTFNSLFEIKKQLVLTSDKTPQQISSLEERLQSRFAWGLIAKIEMPEVETKVAILKKKAQANKIALPNEVAFLLASSVNSNIRELEGLLTRLSAFSSLARVDITLETAKLVLKDFIKKEELDSNPEEIIKTVSVFFNLKPSDLKGKRKSNSIVLPRQIAMYLMRKKTSLSLPEIGHCFGGRDHSTVIYSINKIEKLLLIDGKVRETVEDLLRRTQ
jgi:chromosomal replication initiator protein